MQVLSSTTNSANSTKRILVVDDQRVFADLWKMKLNKLGFEVNLKSNGEEALEVMKREHFDVILLDLFMPKKTGFEVLDAKSETINKDTPTFVITSSTKQEDIQRAMKLGAKKMFLKYEVSPKDVINTICVELGAN